MSNIWTPKSQKGLYGNAVAWLAGILLLVGLIAGIVFGIRWVTAPVKGKLQAREQINSGSFRIAAYNHFFDLCASVQTKEQTIVALEQELATKPTADRRSQIEASITANRAGRADDINTYNADAHKSYTIGQFRSSGLPFTLYPTTKETACVAG